MGGGIFDILTGLVLSGIYKKKVRNQRLQDLLLFAVYQLASKALGNVGKRAVGYDVVKCLVFSAV